MTTDVESSSVEALNEQIDSETAAETSTDLVPILGANLRRLRLRRGLSLERLAKLSGVSRAMLSQVELAYSAPTINVIWRIAQALEVPFSALLAIDDAPPTRVLRRSSASVLTSHDGSFSSRALFPPDASRRTEFYELRIEPGGLERATAHAHGTTENLVLVTGRVAITVGTSEPEVLEVGDSIFFQADVAHVYENRGNEAALLYLVMHYSRDGGS